MSYLTSTTITDSTKTNKADVSAGGDLRVRDDNNRRLLEEILLVLKLISKQLGEETQIGVTNYEAEVL